MIVGPGTVIPPGLLGLAAMLVAPAAAAEAQVKTYVETRTQQETQLPPQQNSMSAAANASPLEL